MLAGSWQDLVGTSVAGRYVLQNPVYVGTRQAEFVAATPGNEGTLVSVALVEPEAHELEPLLAAIDRAKGLKHSNVLPVLDGGECVLEGTQMVFIVSAAAQETLAEAPRPNPRQLLEDVLAGLDWLHSQNLVYRNLNPETVVWADGRWKLADLSQVCPAGWSGAEESEFPNAPPEAAAGRVLPAWDIWSLGLLLRDVMAGKSASLPAPFDVVVSGCLEPDPQRRLKSSDIRRLLILAANAPPTAATRLQTQQVRTAPPRSRAMLVLALAAIASVGALLVARRGPRRERAHPPRAAALPPRAERTMLPPAPRPSPFAATNQHVESAAPTVSKTMAASVAHPAPPPIAAARVVPDAPAEDAAQQIGEADYFANELAGNRTASGEEFDNTEMTAASLHFPLGTRLRVTDLDNGRAVTVRVNDRGPWRPGFVITMTRRAAEELGFVGAGSARVKVELVK
jgi:rare lipoprotein A